MTPIRESIYAAFPGENSSEMFEQSHRDHEANFISSDGEGGHLQVQGAYAQSGPPAANGTDSAAEQQIEAAIPTYAAVDKSKKSRKQADERPPEYAVVDKSQKKKKQEEAAIPTYAAVDKSKKKKKSREEVPAVYAEVDKSKKKKKKKIDDKNLYDNLDEPKKVCISIFLIYYTATFFANSKFKFKSVRLRWSKFSFCGNAQVQKWTHKRIEVHFHGDNITGYLSQFQGPSDRPLKPANPIRTQGMVWGRWN